MARLIHIAYLPHNLEVRASSVHWIPSAHRMAIPNLPQIVWDDGTPFRPANTWSAQRSISFNLKTVHSSMSKLLTYANFLEANELDWFHFPQQKAEQCLIRYRGYLIKCRENGTISPSGATHKMNAAISFYRYVMGEGLIDPNITLWRERRFSISTYDAKGFERTIRVSTTDLSIPNRKRPGLTLEDGLKPLSDEGLKELLRIAKKTQPYEFYLMLLIGSFSGARIGTITDLKVSTLLRAAPDPQFPENKLINVGPGATPPVSTKFDVNGQIVIPDALYKKLLAYAMDRRRIQRQGKASAEDRDILFLNTNGKRYCPRGQDSSSAIRDFTRNLRIAARAGGIAELADFKFHWTRATFATRVTAMLLEKHPVNAVLAFVKNLMLHKNESTTLRYIRFVQNKPIKESAANAFSVEFLGLENEKT